MKNLINLTKNKIYLGLAFAYLLVPFVVVASGHNQGGGTNPTPPEVTGGLKNPIKVNSIGELLVAILDFVFKVGLPIVTLAIIYSGFLFVKAQGKPAELEVARRNLVYVFIGAAIVLGAKTIELLITGTVNNIQSGLE